jgi:hypothetical protein
MTGEREARVTPDLASVVHAITVAAWGYDFSPPIDAGKVGRDLAPKVLAALRADRPPEPPTLARSWTGAEPKVAERGPDLGASPPPPDLSALASAIAYALARADLPSKTETSRGYAERLAPLVIDSGWLEGRATLATTGEPE